MDPSSISTSINLIPSEHPLRVEAVTYMDYDSFKAAQDGDLVLFSKYQGGLHCLVDRRHNTALHIYSRTGGLQVVKNDKQFLCFQKKRFEREFSIKFVKELVDKCPSLLLQPNAKGEIPLHMAARHGHFDVVKFLIECAKVVRREDVEKGLEATNRLQQMLRMRDKDGNTTMHKAVKSGELDVVRLLVKEFDPDFSFSANTSGETPLYIAALTSRDLLVAEILDNCKSMDYGGPDGRTALHAAVMGWSNASIEKLIEANKHLTKKTDDNGRTPLHYAALYAPATIVKLLLESDASAADITDKERGMTALHMAACGDRKGVMQDIISYWPGCCEIVDKRGWNFLHFAALTLGPKRLKKFLFHYKNNIKDLTIRNLLDEKDVNGNRPFEILLYGRPYRDSSALHQAFEVLKIYGSQDFRSVYLGSEIKKKEIRVLLKDLANEEEVLASPYGRIREIVMELEEKEKEKHTSQQEIEDKARESHLVVATLVATVTFAALFTVPGGYKSDEQGTATLIHDSAFKAFIITNTLAFVSSLLAIFLHFFIMMFRVKFREYLREMIQMADHLTIFAMAMMVVAFSTASYAVLQSSSSFAATALFFGLIFFPLPALLYLSWLLLNRIG